MDRERARSALKRLLGTLSPRAALRLSEPLIEQFLDALQDGEKVAEYGEKVAEYGEKVAAAPEQPASQPAGLPEYTVKIRRVW
jgi:hypothetical protein